MNRGIVYYRDVPAGTLERDAEGFTFRYNASCLDNSSFPDISATLPKRKEEYRSKELFSSFYGLLAEGKQKERQCRELCIDENDHFTRLLETSCI